MITLENYKEIVSCPGSELGEWKAYYRDILPRKPYYGIKFKLNQS